MRTFKIVLKMMLVVLFLCFIVMSAKKATAEEATIEDVGIDVIESITFPDAYIFTGAAQNTIPIIVPPGRGGIAPNLALKYYSYRRNSWVGLGWDLDLGVIQRATKHGVDYSVDDYIFIKDIHRTELVARSDWGTDYYGAKIEGEFAKFYLNSSTGGWEVTARDGTTYFYGSTADSRQDNTYGVFNWCLDRVEDPNGNYMTVTYTKDQGQLYPDRIDYTGHTGGLSPTNYVQFYLEDRTDAPKMYQSNAAVKTAKRLKSIDIVADGDRARVYQLTYTQSEATARSLLASVQQYGSDATIDANGDITGGTALPAIECNYAAEANAFGSPDTQWGVGIGLYGGLGCSLGDLNGDGKADFLYPYTSPPWGETYDQLQVQLSTGDGFGPDTLWGETVGDITVWASDDLNGDGKADFLYMLENYLRVMLSTGDGFGPETSWGSTNYIVGSWDIFDNVNGFALGDLNGDGKADFFYNSFTSLRVLLSTGDGFGPDTSWGTASANIAAWALADLNGDGKLDFLYQPDDYSNALRVMLSEGDGFGPDTQWGETLFGITGVNGFSPSEDKFYFSSHSGFKGFPYVAAWTLADFNGDGKKDFLYSPMGYSFRVMLSTGDGFTTEAQWGENPTVTKDDWGNYFVDDFTFADLNGDGKTDFFYEPRGTTQLRVMLSTGDSFGPDTQWGTTIYYSEQPNGKLADFTGDGKADFVHGASYSTAWVVASDPDKTMLLSSFSNGFGAVSNIEYTPSSEYENTLIPFVLQTASRITLDDGNDVESTTDYTYAGGYYDYETREFRGFSDVIRTNPDGTIVTTLFHQDEYRRGRKYQVDLQKPVGEQDPLLTRTTLIWELDPASPPEGSYAFVKLVQQYTEYYDAMTVYAQEDYTYDNSNGNLLSKTTSGNYAETITTANTYGNYGAWLWRLTGETITGATSGTVRQTTYDYDGNGNMESKTPWLDGGTYSTTVYMTYDPYGNTETVTDARGYTTETQYDDITHTYPKKITSPQTQDGKDHIIEYPEYDYRFGKPIRKVDEKDYETTYDYDPFGRLKQIDHPDDGQKTVTYYDTATPPYILTKVKENTSGDTIDTYMYFDGLGRTIQTITFGENNTIVTRTYYDDMGRVELEQGPFFGAGVSYPQSPPSEYPYIQTAYDYRGRPTQVTSPDGTYGTVTTSYSYYGFATTITDPDSKSKTEWRDYFDRITQVTEEGSQNTIYVYNAADDLLTVTDSLGNTTTNTYDTLGRKIAMDDPDLGYWQYTYDANGNRISETNGRTLVSVVTETTEIHNTYDEMNRVKTEKKIIEGAPEQEYTTEYDYDLAGKPTKTTYPDNYEVDYVYYPGTGLLHTVTGSDNEVYALCTQYEPTGKMGNIAHDNDTATAYTYDSKSTRLTGIVTVDSSSSEIQHRTYTYSKAGDIIEIIDDEKGITYTYTYDDLHRLTSETNTGIYDPINYSYNAIGNITQKVVGSDTLDYAYDPEHKHAVKTIAFNSTDYQYTYDEVGNLTAGPDFTDSANIATRSIAYYADDKPATIEHAEGGNIVITDIVYDGLGNRVRKIVQGGAATYYIGKHFEVKDGTETKYIFAGNLRVAQVADSEQHYFHKDHLSSSTVMTDAAGIGTETSEYLPYGGMREHAGQAVSDYKFTDQEQDPSTGLYNFRARLYDPIIGRFISADPTIPHLYDPQSLNRYTYCQNNPLVYVDPNGLQGSNVWNTSDFFGYTGIVSWGPWGKTGGVGYVNDAVHGPGLYGYWGNADGYGAAIGGEAGSLLWGNSIGGKSSLYTAGLENVSVAMITDSDGNLIGYVFAGSIGAPPGEASKSDINTWYMSFSDIAWMLGGIVCGITAEYMYGDRSLDAIVADHLGDIIFGGDSDESNKNSSKGGLGQENEGVGLGDGENTTVTDSTGGGGDPGTGDSSFNGDGGYNGVDGGDWSVGGYFGGYTF